MDAFFASVEQHDDPELRGRPVLVGHDGPRGVVAAASYEARAFGCHSAQPVAIAKRCCPDAVIVPPRGARYRDVSRQVFDILHTFTPLVEPLSIDEAFLDVTGSIRLLGSPCEIALAIKRTIRETTGVTASIGVAPNKFLAKLASDMDKPDGLTVLEASNLDDVLPGLPISRMWGVGPVTEQKLRRLGIRTFGDLADMPAATLAAFVGPHAESMRRLARGRDDRSVTPDHDAKSISHEQTFGADLADPDAVRRVLMGQAEQVAARLRRHHLAARTITVKIRYGDFETITRSTTLPRPTDQTVELAGAATGLFDRWTRAGFRPVRLIGVGAHQLRREDRQLGLFADEALERRHRLDLAADEIVSRFGKSAIRRAAALPEPDPPTPSPPPGDDAASTCPSSRRS
jgi:DNA polymerase-4